MKNFIAPIALICILVMAASADAQERRKTTGSRVRTAKASAPVRVASNKDKHISKASYAQVVEGEVIHEGVVHEGIVDSGCDSCGSDCGGSCGTEIGAYCGTCATPRGFCICFPSHGWVQTEYLSWHPSGMRVPALVTTSPAGTARAQAGVLGQTGTSILYGADEDILDGERGGFRIRFGWWLSSFPCWGIEGEYTGLGEETESFFQQSTSDPIIARPFFNALTAAQDSELVAFPAVVSGSVGVDVTSEFDGAAFRFRRQLCSSEGCCFSNLACKTVPWSSRLDATIGYRFWELDESIRIREQLQMLTTTQPGSFDITDRFETRNQFNGTELGFIWQGRRGWWSLEALMRVAVGNVHQTVTIGGNSTIVDNGATSNFDNGFLAQRTNSGTFDRDAFTMIPEFGLTLGYQLTQRLRGTIGYSAIYWGNVVRPGDQIDLDLNPNLLAPEVTPFAGPLRPQFDFVETDYLVQGLSFGADFRW